MINNEIKKRIEQINSGQVPEGYKKEFGFIIPKDWELAKLKNYFNRLTEKNIANNQNVLTISAQKGLINQEQYYKRTVASENKSNYFLIKKGDFAYNKSYSTGYAYGTIKKLKFYDTGIVSPLYICFRPNKNNECPDFFEHYFNANLFNSEINAIAQEGARNHGLLNIGINDFFNTNIINPQPKEQQQIAEILSTCDQVIELKENLLTEKQKQKKWLMQNLLTGKIRVRALAGKWKETKLGKVCETFSGGTPDRSKKDYYANGTIPWIKSGDLNQKIVRNVNEYITEEAYNKSSAKIVEPEDILLALYGATAGVIAISKIKAAINQAVLCIKISEKIKNNFLFYYLEYKMNETIETYTQGGQPNFNARIIKNLSIKVPKIDEQEAIAEILSTADKELDLLQKEIDEYKQLKKSLMQLLLTGVVRVNKLEINNKIQQKLEVLVC